MYCAQILNKVLSLLKNDIPKQPAMNYLVCCPLDHLVDQVFVVVLVLQGLKGILVASSGRQEAESVHLF